MHAMAVADRIYRWREICELEPTDPIFQLPIQALQKLNSYRDIEYLKRIIRPDSRQMQEFRLAHRFLHVWARERGVYAGKFGFLNGFAIALMLFRVLEPCLPHDDDAVATAPNLIATFFSYYSAFDWAADMVHDPAFAMEKKKYRRSAREVMVVLSLHAPRVNVVRAASLPALRTISEEIHRADRLLEEPDVSWESLIGADGAGEFLRAYRSYVKIDVSYWGSSLAKGSSLVGWLESKCVVLLVGKPPSHSL
jgi:poly(A) polymerase Pap1